MLFKFTSIIAVSTFLSACAIWPPQGQGGQAESFKTETTYRNEIRSQNINRIECFDRKLQGLSNSKVKYQHPAALAKLSIQWTRIIRAHAAKLDFEAKQDLILLQNEFEQLDKFLKQTSSFQLISTARNSGGTCL